MIEAWYGCGFCVPACQDDSTSQAGRTGVQEVVVEALRDGMPHVLVMTGKETDIREWTTAGR